MVRNEQDTIAHVVCHLFSQGVDEIVIADNNSTDQTRDILVELASEFSIHIVIDTLVAYHQSLKMTMLSNLARNAGADWIIPFDADELWYANDSSLADHLRLSAAQVSTAHIYNVFPAHSDSPNERNPFLRLQSLDPQPHPLVKQAFRSHRLVEVGSGQHGILRRGERGDGLYIAHYPWRTMEQFATKLRHGMLAVEEATDESKVCRHWRVGGAQHDDWIEAAWEQLCSGIPVPEIVWSPQGVLVQRDLFSCQTWPV